MSGDYIFHEGDILDHFFLIVEGEVDIIMEITGRSMGYSRSDQLFGNIKTINVSIDTLGKGEFFGWSALVSFRHASTTGAVAVNSSWVVAFNCLTLQAAFQIDNNFGYLMAQTAAHEINRKLKKFRLEMLSTFAMKADRLYVGFGEGDHQSRIPASTTIHQISELR
jgi:CRP-like cAMP-binding protein